MAAKRNLIKCFDIQELQQLEKPIPKANVEGVITGLSPTKKGRNSTFFDGTLSDGRAKTRMVGFSSLQQKSLDGFLGKRETIQLTDCEIKKARRGDEMEVLLKSTTKITKSSKEFVIPEAEFSENEPKNIILSELGEMEEYQTVNVKVKVISVTEPQIVGTARQLKKQDVTVADSSDVARVTLWEDDIDCLEEEQCYLLKKFSIREYNAVKYMTMSRNESKVEKISDIIDVSTDCEQKLNCEPTSTLRMVKIIAVISLDSHKVCLRCRARVEPATPPFSRCSKCSMLQAYDICTESISAKLMFMTNEKGQRTMETLIAPGNILELIAGRPAFGEDLMPITERELCLKECDEVSFYSESKVIYCVRLCRSAIESTV